MYRLDILLFFYNNYSTYIVPFQSILLFPDWLMTSVLNLIFLLGGFKKIPQCANAVYFLNTTHPRGLIVIFTNMQTKKCKSLLYIQRRIKFIEMVSKGNNTCSQGINEKSHLCLAKYS